MLKASARILLTGIARKIYLFLKRLGGIIVSVFEAIIVVNSLIVEVTKI